MKSRRRRAAAARTAIAADEPTNQPPPDEFREVDETQPAPPASLSAEGVGSYLDSIRNEALERFARLNRETRDAQYNASRVIAELEEWRNQINCTIAFLKAQRRE